MWPFSKTPDISELQTTVNELVGWRRIVDRDLEDLNARYRRLRAGIAGDTRAALAAVETNQDDPGTAMTGKNALRARFFGKFGKPPGNGQ